MNVEPSGKDFPRGSDLIRDIDGTITATPTLWWLGRSGFVVRFANITFYVDPCLSRAGYGGAEPPIEGGEVHHADMILSTHAHPGHMDGAALVRMLDASKSAKLVLPKSAGDYANSLGIPYARMTTTDSDLRIEYWKDNLYGRVYAVPSAHPQLDWTPLGGYPYLGYLIRFGRWTIYHAGDCAPYNGLASRLRPYNVSVALLPVGGKNFSIGDAADLASAIGAAWLVPMHYSEPDETAFVEHMLGQCPDQAFKVFQIGEKWTVPEE